MKILMRQLSALQSRVPTASILFETCSSFPQYKVPLLRHSSQMTKVEFDEEVLEELTPETQLPLVRVTKLKGNVIKVG